MEEMVILHALFSPVTHTSFLVLSTRNANTVGPPFVIRKSGDRMV